MIEEGGDLFVLYGGFCGLGDIKSICCYLCIVSKISCICFCVNLVCGYGMM